MFTALLVLIFVSSGSAQGIRYVRSSSSHDCPGEPCLNLHQYMIEQVSKYFTDGSTFIFLPGNHTSQTAACLSSVSNITLKGESDAKIFVDSEILCEHVRNLTILRLKFLLTFSGDPNTMSAWKIVHSMDIFINHSVFEGNEALRTAGRALQLQNSTMSISNCLFLRNAAYDGGAFCAFYSTINIDRTNFTENRADRCGGAICVEDSIINIYSSIFTGNSVGISLQGSSGGAIAALNSVIIY